LARRLLLFAHRQVRDILCWSADIRASVLFDSGIHQFNKL
jgi:hypothetical protein